MWLICVTDRASRDQSIWSRRQSVRLGCAGQRVGELWGCSDGLCARVSGTGPRELRLSAVAVSLLELIREGNSLGRKDVMSCVGNPMEAQLLFVPGVAVSQTTWAVMGASW